MINTIPVSKLGWNDILVWHFDNKGVYTVKSGYKLLCLSQHQEQNASLTLNIRGDKEMWDRVWYSDVPTKLRVFMWKVQHDILPVLTNLAKKRVPVDVFCPRCKQAEETVAHALRDCLLAQEVWSKVEINWGSNCDFLQLFNEWFVKAVTHLERKELQLFIMTLWTIWNDRNNELYEDRKRDANISAQSVKNYQIEFNQANFRIPDVPDEQQDKWKPPDAGLFKVNFDGAMTKNDSTGGIGVIVRDHTGQCMGALSVKVQLIASPFQVEAMAAIKALNFAHELGMTKIVLEGDSLTIIKKLQQSLEQDLSPVGNLIDEARQKMHAFRYCCSIHTKRQGNLAAHTLAQQGLRVDEEMYWVEDFPDYRCMILTIDA
ncbi:hypothetical protein REPUB_Repub16aG0017000 [Reevesia pubescens]